MRWIPRMKFAEKKGGYPYSCLETNLSIPMKNQKGRAISDPVLSSYFNT